ncbi:shikimate kinase [Flammeovirga sp. SubArs3]|uniref:shikimate kinase n=1 Tax=Flammeovirga sp. SubArs3 TaxID=2995316 RepID=UPI00248C7BDD|nr:shikimate kinase [Flammeovirga sp. SubArs3]
MRIYLVGMPGSGKSTLAKELSELISLPFYDMDSEIEIREEAPIPTIFELNGEDYFRKVEQKVVQEFKPDNSIIATGGGAPCFFNNMEVLNRLGTTVFVDIAPLELTERVWEQHGSRPLLAQESKEEIFQAIQAKREQRLPFYNKAQIIINGGVKTPKELAEEIKEALY